MLHYKQYGYAHTVLSIGQYAVLSTDYCIVYNHAHHTHYTLVVFSRKISSTSSRLWLADQWIVVTAH